MKTVKAIPTSSKPVSLTKAEKILSLFVSVENGSSQAIGAYLRRACEAFSELNQVHRDIRHPPSERKHKRNDLDLVVGERILVESQNLRNESPQNKQGKHQACIKGEENQILSVGRLTQGSATGLVSNMVMEEVVEKHKDKKKRKKPDFEAKVAGDHGSKVEEQVELKPSSDDKLSQEPEHKVGGIENEKEKKKKRKPEFEANDAGDHGIDLKEQAEVRPALNVIRGPDISLGNDVIRDSAEKKQKKDKKRKRRDKSPNDFVHGSGEVHNIRIKEEIEIEHVNVNVKKHNKSGLADQSGSDKHVKLENGNIYEIKDVLKVNTEDVMEEGKRKRKKDDAEDTQEGGSKELHSKKKRRKKSEGDN